MMVEQRLVTEDDCCSDGSEFWRILWPKRKREEKEQGWGSEGIKFWKVLWPLYERKGVKQVVVKRITGINNSTISRYLSGDRIPEKVTAVYRIAKALKCSNEELELLKLAYLCEVFKKIEYIICPEE